MNIEIITNIAAITSGFGTAVLIFRIEHESKMEIDGETVWLPLSDYLILTTIFSSLALVLVPIFIYPLLVDQYLKFFRAIIALSIVFELGYIFSILAHYRIIFSGHSSGPRKNPEPPERVIFITTIIFGLLIFALTLLI